MHTIHSLDGEKLAQDLRRRRIQWGAAPMSLGLTGRAPLQDRPAVNERLARAAERERSNVRQRAWPEAVKGLLLRGVCDPESPLARLRGHGPALDAILAHVEDAWAAHVDRSGVYASTVGHVSFPPFTGVRANMMPFVLGDETTLPEELRPYTALIDACPLPYAEFGRVCYLTVDESEATEGSLRPQRRGGVHTESPGLVVGDDGGHWAPGTGPYPPSAFHWGRGFYDEAGEMGNYVGGIFLASNVGASTRLWNARVRAGTPASGLFGSLEHLRRPLGPGYDVPANELVWLTDETPHESLPLAPGTRRQFFRLVTSDVSAWYADHSTANPLGVELPAGVRVVRGDKFEALRAMRAEMYR